MMKLGELLMVRAQLQKDLQEQASLVTENAVRVVGDTEPPAHDAEEALRGMRKLVPASFALSDPDELNASVRPMAELYTV